MWRRSWLCIGTSATSVLTGDYSVLVGVNNYFHARCHHRWFKKRKTRTNNAVLRKTRRMWRRRGCEVMIFYCIHMVYSCNYLCFNHLIIRYQLNKWYVLVSLSNKNTHTYTHTWIFSCRLADKKQSSLILAWWPTLSERNVCELQRSVHFIHWSESIRFMKASHTKVMIRA